MRPVQLFISGSVLLLSSILVFSTSSCKKHPDDTPAVKVDTLSAGWIKIPPISNLNPGAGGGDIFFIDQNTGYTSSRNAGIYTSTNGGVDWQPLTTVGATNLAMTPDKKLFSVGHNNSVFHFIDGNATPVETDLGNSRSIDIFFVNNQTGLATSSNDLFLTTNGGDSWTGINDLPNSDTYHEQNSSIAMSGPNAWVVYSKYILHSNGNNYSNWSLDSIPGTFTDVGLIAVSAPTPDVVYASSYSGYVFKSTDGGNSINFIYKPENLSNNNLFSDIHFVSANTGYLSLGYRLYKTTDGGNTWNVVVSLATSDFLEIHFVDENHGWGLCFDGTVLKLN